MASGVTRVADRLEKPELDDRSYRVIRLPNRLEALLVHDPDTDKASASANVNVGNFSDDDSMPGMAHAVEHLLFMGTEKYPKENAYNQYLAAHSGSSNAYTGAIETNYFFEVAATGESSDGASTPLSDGSAANGSASNASSNSNSVPPLYGALDRFAQFFIAPLFLESTLDRELRAVDSENKKNLQSDIWRLMQLNKSLSNPKHPYHHFSTGNLQTLRDDPQARGVEIRSEFINFHKKHYSANRTKLVVLGRESLDQLESWVVELFSEVQNKDLPQNRWDDVQPFSADQLCTQVFAKPVMDSRSLDIYFPFLDEDGLYETHPSRYISHLIGHEGPGSILAHIKAKGWANGLSAGAMPLCPGASFFTISVRLTEDGLVHHREVVKTIFQYIALIKERTPEQWIFDEMKNLAEVDFRFKQKSPASRFTSRLSSVMQKPLPREWLLSGNNLLRKFDAELITKALSYLRADNFRLMIVSQNFPGDWDTKEKWYGTEYKVEKIPEDFMGEIRNALASSSSDRIQDLHMPHKNEFIPTRLSVEKKEVSQPTKAPKLIRLDDQVRVWYKKDDRFWVPKATVHITLRNSLVWATPANHVKAKIYCELVRDALVEYSYDAELAGLDYNLSASIFGLDISVGGYNDKMSVLLEKVILTMRDLVIKEDRFKIIKERLTRAYRNAEYQQPYYQVGDMTRYLTAEKTWINEQYAAELEHIEAGDVATFFPQLLQQNHIEVLAHGNLYKEDALKMTNIVENIVRSRSLPQSQWHVRRNIIFPPGSNYIYERQLKDPQNVNNCIEYYLFVGSIIDNALRAKLLLFAQMTEEPAFDQLRSKEQLGYVVWSGARYSATTIGYRVIIQSERTAEYLESRIDAFLGEFAQTLEKMTDEEFEGHKRSIINKRLEKLKNLGSETARFWTHIGSEYFNFVQHEVDAASVRSLTKDDLAAFFNQYINPTSETRAKVSIHLNAQSADVDNSRVPVDTSETAEGADALHSQKTNGVKVHKGEPIYITNVPQFKARLPVSAGPSPVVDLSEFEDFDPKL
ncbi:a-pheromone processing metallopeptidase Ste23 [Talaromyces proteolyticus]|uniref:A-pheromone processing metallopeptidase Ste23 n=1 Tax=Talaromyces proteolyticus TaxID=1131652 RepID=A0AAD4KWV1_9EURO|nr:a-pheromone processing metallopeptidase Ste23 [Talaromyces proteolyticus]KAH8697779.1 a-pheromone processing metallopeptidase Ste23 [Talaromyces proteolyticus]